MANRVSIKRCYALASILVAFGCIVGLILMVSTMPHCPPQNCPTPDDQTAQKLPDSASLYGTDVVFEDSVTSLTTSDIDDTYRRRDKITQRKPQGKSFPFTRTETSNAVPQLETSVEESPVPNTYTSNIKKHSGSTGSAKVSESVHEILSFSLDLMSAAKGVSDTGTTESFKETKTLTLVIKRQVKGGVEAAHDFHTETETHEIVIDKVFTGVASSDVNDPLNAKTTYKINIERKLNGLGHSASIESPAKNGIFNTNIEKTVNGIGSSNKRKQSTDEPRTFELDIDTVKERVAALDDFEEPDNASAIFKVDIEGQRNGLGYSDSIDSARENGISDMDIEKTVNGIGSSNTSKQSTDESRNFELDIEKVMENIAALDDFENVDATLTVDIERQSNGLRDSDSIDSPNVNKTFNTQIINETQLYELNIGKVMEGVAAVNVSQDSDNVNATLKVDVERQFNGIGYSDSFDSPNGNDRDIEKTVNGIGSSRTTNRTPAIAPSNVSDVSLDNRTPELDVVKTAIATSSSIGRNSGKERPENSKLNLQKQVVGIGSRKVNHSPKLEVDDSLAMEKTRNGIGFSNTNNEDKDLAFKLDIGREVKAIAPSDVTDDSLDNRTPELDVEKTAIATSSSASRKSSKERPKNSKLNLQKQVVGIGSKKLHRSSNQTDNSAYLGKEITGIGSSQRQK